MTRAATCSRLSREQRDRGHLPTLDQTEGHELGHDPGDLCDAHAGETGHGAEVELGSGLGEDRQYATLCAGDDRLDRMHEVHGRDGIPLQLINETNVSYLRCSGTAERLTN